MRKCADLFLLYQVLHSLERLRAEIGGDSILFLLIGQILPGFALAPTRWLLCPPSGDRCLSILEGPCFSQLRALLLKTNVVDART